MTLPLPDMLCFALYSATHAIQGAYKPLLDDLGLTYPQYLVLVVLWGKDGQTVGQIGRLLALQSNTLTPLLKRMEVQGWLTRSRDAADERQVRVALSPDGAAMQARAAQLPEAIRARTGLDVADLIDLRERITALNRHLRQG